MRELSSPVNGSVELTENLEKVLGCSDDEASFGGQAEAEPANGAKTRSLWMDDIGPVGPDTDNPSADN